MKPCIAYSCASLVHSCIELQTFIRGTPAMGERVHTRRRAHECLEKATGVSASRCPTPSGTAEFRWSIFSLSLHAASDSVHNVHSLYTLGSIQHRMVQEGSPVTYAGPHARGNPCPRASADSLSRALSPVPGRSAARRFGKV